VVNSSNSTDGRFGVNVYTEAPPNYLPCRAPDNRSELARIGRLGMVFKNPKSGKVQNVCFYVFFKFSQKTVSLSFFRVSLTKSAILSRYV